MPSGLLEGVSENDVRGLLTFLINAPPTRRAGESVLKAPLKIEEPRKSVVLVASKQDHGPGQHDYPAWQTNWMSNSSSPFKFSSAWEWPSAEQWKTADAVVFYFWNHDWSDSKLSELDEFQKRGGGLVVLHAGCIADKEPQKLASRIGLAAQPVATKYLHTPFTLKIAGESHPIGFKKAEIALLDEPYWPMIGDEKRVQIIATARVENLDRPMIWTYQAGAGRVFVSIPGHYTWTLRDPLFEEMLFAAINWVAAQR